MRRLPALLVALLFVGATVLPAAGVMTSPAQLATDGSSAPGIMQINGTTNHLAIPAEDVRASSYNDSGVDVGTVVRVGSDRLHHRHDSQAFQQRFERLETTRQRTQLIERQLSTVESRQTALDERQSQALRQYASGERSAMAFLRIRTVVDAEADALLATLEQVDTAPDTEPAYTTQSELTTRLRTAEGNLRTLTGPVGERLRSPSADTNIIYIEVSTEGYTLATVDDDRYIRETRLNDQREPTATDQFLQQAAQQPNRDRFNIVDERASELYTWLYERQRPSFTYFGTSGIYELTATHTNGHLTSYLDGGTTNVFYEHQNRQLSGVQSTGTQTATNGTLRVTLDRSTETGPLLVSASDNETETPVDGRVTIDGQPVGTTGSDGRLWTVEPREPYAVNVTTNNTRTTVVVWDATPERLQSS